MPPSIWWKIPFTEPFLTDLIRYLIRSVLEGGPKFTKIGLAMAVTFQGAAANNGNSTYLLLIMFVGSHKIGLYDLKNWTQLRKVKIQEQCTQSICVYFGIHIVIHTRLLLLRVHKCCSPVNKCIVLLIWFTFESQYIFSSYVWYHSTYLRRAILNPCIICTKSTQKRGKVV